MQVIIVTHAYGDCRGVRWLTNGLKVYYLHRRNMYQQTCMPTLFVGMALIRHVLIREGITLVHAHQAFSVLGLETILHARTMGYQVVFTDHSLFGFADASSIFMNKALKCSLADVCHALCVSHTSRENTVLRACLPPSRISVIPNAVDMSIFRPRDAPAAAPWPRSGLEDPVTVVILSRLVYRKGLDLVALALPHVCATHPNVKFLIGGGGPKSRLLNAVVAQHGLEGRVQLEGPVAPEQAAAFMCRGHIFLNASLTEAFCMAIVEAAACGLLVVSTRVGGVPEVLPGDMVELADPSAEGLCEALTRALKRVGRVRPLEQHERVAGMYSWKRVASRTLAVYDLLAIHGRNVKEEPARPGGGAGVHTVPDGAGGSAVDADPSLAGQEQASHDVYDYDGQGTEQGVECEGLAKAKLFPAQLLDRLHSHMQCGTWAGPWFSTLIVWLHWWWVLLDWWLPAKDIERVPDWPLKHQQ